MSVVVCKDLVKRFGSQLAVDHVNIEIQDGEFMVFVGPSGCGKTTTLRMIGGLETITSGEIFVDGELV
ncbi:MAG: ABC transporter ATP-binding protein, partial [Ardenticatenia bacterium]|nr:ABC transporter ATP-binding protein [Ardenticatenia bacterium]